MKRIFESSDFFTVPDGTDVSILLNASDVIQTTLPSGSIGDISIAAGKVRPGISSWIHSHPAVMQVTYVTLGRLTVWMKDTEVPRPYAQSLESGQAVVCQPGTLFQLQNVTDTTAEVLYIVSPSYLFETEGTQIVYDDAIMVAETWGELEAAKYEVPGLKVKRAEQAAKRGEAARWPGLIASA